jgi:hypothetical protein
VPEDSGPTPLGLSGLDYAPGGGPLASSQTLAYTITKLPPSWIGVIYRSDRTPLSLGATTLDVIRGLTFTPASNVVYAGNPDGDFEFNVIDTGGLLTPDTSDALKQSMKIIITPVNDPPVVTMSTAAIVYTTGNSTVSVDSALTVADIDSQTLASADFQIRPYYRGEDVLIFNDPPEIVGSFDEKTGILHLYAAGGTNPTLAQWQGVLETVLYQNTTLAHLEARSITLLVTDDLGGTSAAASRTITFSPELAPTIDFIGVYSPATSLFHQAGANGSDAKDTCLAFGTPGAGWLPVVGDWNGDGVNTLGVYDPFASVFYLRDVNLSGYGETVACYGLPGGCWMPIAGDWFGTGHDTIGLYDPVTSFFYLSGKNANGYADVTLGFGEGLKGWLPMVGDWNGDGIDTIGLYDPQTGRFYLKNSNTTGYADSDFLYGVTNSQGYPIAGKWTGGIRDTVGIYCRATGEFYLSYANGNCYADCTFSFGPAEGIPIIGDWNGPALLRAAESLGTPGAGAAALTASEATPVVEAAVGRWADLSPDLGAALANVQTVITDLPGDRLGQAIGNVLYLDRDAAGHGWFVDTTPAVDEEFTRLGTDSELSAVDPQAVDRIDLVTVVEHELGHMAGLKDLDDSATGLMSGRLSTGLRRLAGQAEADALFARHDQQALRWSDELE